MKVIIPLRNGLRTQLRLISIINCLRAGFLMLDDLPQKARESPVFTCEYSECSDLISAYYETKRKLIEGGIDARYWDREFAEATESLGAGDAPWLSSDYHYQQEVREKGR